MYIKCPIWASVALLASSHLALAQVSPPVIRFSDLESGPNSGGQNNAGAFVTIYGAHFGATQGTSVVTVGGGPASAYPIWTDTKVTFQLGLSAATGDIVITTPVGASNGLPFTVRPGNIYFVSTTGSNSANGSYATPWLTLPHSRDQLVAGDILYAMNGVSQLVDDGNGWATTLLLRTSGTAGAPLAIIAYPGATVTIGSSTGPGYGIRGIDNGTLYGYWVFAGLVLRGSTGAVATAGTSSYWRFVGNDMSCPNGNGEGACFATQKSNYVYFYGNNIHDTGVSNASAEYQGVYFSTDSNHIDMGWNTVANVHGCRGVQFHSSPLGPGGSGDPTGHDTYDITVHDNLIHDTQCDGIILDTIDPSQGAVKVYNNIIYNAGKGPNNPEHSGGWACINVTGGTENGPAGSGTVQVYNNTLYNCGAFANPPYQDSNAGVENGGHSTSITIFMQNNLIYMLNSSATYLSIWTNNDLITGTNNLFYGIGSSPPNSTYVTGSVMADPLLVNASGYDFHLTAASPAATDGTTTPQTRDFDSVPLPQGPGYPIGALAYPIYGGSSPIAVTVAPSSISLRAGGIQQFTASVTGTSATNVTWSMNPVIGTLSASGLYTAPSSIATPQTVVVTATSVVDPTKSGIATITLMPLVAVTVTPATVTLGARQNQQFTSTVNGTSNTAVTWSMSPAVGTLSSAGLYTAPASITIQQNVVIRATSVADPTKFAAATVTLMPAVSVSVTPTTISLGAHLAQKFTAAVSGASNTAVTWSMSPAVGLLSSAGLYSLYTAPASIPIQQNVVIRATSVADPTKFAAATVTLKPAVSVSVTPTTVSLGARHAQKFTAAVSGATNTAVTWSMSPAVGTLSSAGLYTAPALITIQKNVVITATSVADPTKFATATVTLRKPAQTLPLPNAQHAVSTFSGLN